MYIAKSKIRSINKDGERVLYKAGEEVKGLSKAETSKLVNAGVLEQVKTEKEKAK